MQATLKQHSYPLHQAAGGHVLFRHYWIWGDTPEKAEYDGAMQDSVPNQVFDYLMAQRPDAIKLVDQQGLLAIHCAAYYNNVHAVRSLLAHDRSLAWAAAKPPENEKFHQPYVGCLPIHFAAFAGAEAVFDELLSLDPTLRNAQGAFEGNYENWQNGKGGHWDPIGCAAVSGHTSIVRKLLDLDPELARSPGAKSALPLTYAALCGSMSTFTLLLTHTPEAVNGIGWEDKTNLMLLLEAEKAAQVRPPSMGHSPQIYFSLSDSLSLSPLLPFPRPPFLPPIPLPTPPSLPPALRKLLKSIQLSPLSSVMTARSTRHTSSRCFSRWTLPLHRCRTCSWAAFEQSILHLAITSLDRSCDFSP